MSKGNSIKFISNLKVINFRSYKELDFKSLDKNIVLVGENGSGKTNLLEALSLIAPGRGLRSSDKAKFFRISNENLNREKSWAVHLKLIHNDEMVEISTGISSSLKTHNPFRTFSVNGKIIKSSEISPYITFNWLTPQMDSIISGSESGRRKFIDRLISNFDYGHLGRLKRLEKNFRERLIILENKRYDQKWLSLIEKKISEDGIAVVESRMSFISSLDEITACPDEKSFTSVRMQMKGDIETYISKGSAIEAEDKFYTFLQKNRSFEKLAIGPNASSLVLWHGNSGMTSEYCSTGQQKAILLSLVLGYSKYLNKIFGSPPILLLDEINAHMDSKNFQAFYEYSKFYNGQIWMTGTDIRLFKSLKKKNKIEFFNINNSNVTKL